jgi:hypothetical protein
MRGKHRENEEMNLQETMGDKVRRILKKVTIKYVIRE